MKTIVYYSLVFELSLEFEWDLGLVFLREGSILFGMNQIFGNQVVNCDSHYLYSPILGLLLFP